MANRQLTRDDNQKYLIKLKADCGEIWRRQLGQSRVSKLIMSGEIDKEFCAMYLVETYHYTKHNSRNQALVGVRANGISDRYRSFCFSHAAEETGHENMALHDMLAALEIRKADAVLPEPLPATDVLIGYLYWISATGNPLQRLGYSFWAESCYEFINPFINLVRDKLQLKDSQMTFFKAHSDIDAEHSKEVDDMLLTCCGSEKDWADVTRVMKTSLELSLAMVDAVVDAYADHKSGRAPRPIG